MTFVLSKREIMGPRWAGLGIRVREGEGRQSMGRYMSTLGYDVRNERSHILFHAQSNRQGTI